MPSLACSISTAIKEVSANELRPSWLVSKVWVSGSEEGENKNSLEFISWNNFVLPGSSFIGSGTGIGSGSPDKASSLNIFKLCLLANSNSSIFSALLDIEAGS